MDYIDQYSRAQAIEDGVLIDVSETAKEAGIRFPTAITRTAWTKYVEVPPDLECQDESGRLWDVVWMLRYALSRVSRNASVIEFKLFVKNDERPPQPVILKAVCGPGDNLEPAITIMLLGED